mgnify:CR=1 FL=1
MRGAGEAIFVRRRDDRAPLNPEDDRQDRQQLYTVVLPPTARGVGQTIRELALDKGAVTVSAIRREVMQRNQRPRGVVSIRHTPRQIGPRPGAGRRSGI